MLRSDRLLGLDQFRVRLSERRRRGRRRLVESGRDPALLLVNLFHSLHLLVLGDSLEVLSGSIEQGDTNVSGLERTNVVGAVSSHKSRVAKILERVENKLLLRWGDSSVNPSVLDEIEPGGSVLVLLERGSSNANVVVVEDLLVKRLLRVDRDDLGLVNVSPYKLIGRGALLEVENHDLSVDNLDIPSDVNGSKRVVSGNHDTLPVSCQPQTDLSTYSVRRIGKHFEDLDRIGLERAVEDQESSKFKLALDFVSGDVVDLNMS